jgi:hypothetical protein
MAIQRFLGALNGTQEIRLCCWIYRGLPRGIADDAGRTFSFQESSTSFPQIKYDTANVGFFAAIIRPTGYKNALSVVDSAGGERAFFVRPEIKTL